jgi:hypothetical protein
MREIRGCGGGGYVLGEKKNELKKLIDKKQGKSEMDETRKFIFILCG